VANARRPVFAGRVVGILTFLVGIGLLFWTFQLAYHMFTVPQSVALGMKDGQAVDLPKAGEALANVLLRIVLLLVMAIVGSVIANRGIKLYDTLGHPPEPSAPTEAQPGSAPPE
jgi:hypothetical protein